MNKRRFRKSLAQNAVYMKYKRVIPIVSSGANANSLFTVNFNGNESTAGLNNAACYHQYDSGTSTATAYPVTTDSSFIGGDIFDQNRFAALKVKWLPAIPAGANQGEYGYQVVLKDRDGIDQPLHSLTPSSSIAQLQEQVNGVRVRNMYRPWKTYIKAPKYGINNRIPTQTPAYLNPANGYDPNTNLGGQWKRVLSWISNDWDGTPGSQQYVNRGSQFAFVTQRPTGLAVGPHTLGFVELTAYFVYKDRQ